MAIADVNSPKSTTATTATTRANSNSRSTLRPTLEEDESSSAEETNSPSTLRGGGQSRSEEVQSSSKYYPGETTREDLSTQSRSTYSPGRPQRSTQAAPRGVTREDVTEIVGEAMKQLMDTLIDPEMRQGRVDDDMTGVNLPLEDVQLTGEKVNYRIALNPEIFFRYSVFKARVATLGRKWDGTFADWIDMATKDILAIYGMYPTVLTTRGKSFTVDIPAGVQSGEVE